MRSIIPAIVISIAVHALLAFGLAAYLEYAPVSDVVATLDLTSVELSFTEKVEESAAVVPVPPVPLEPSKPKAEDRPPEQKIEKTAPDPLAPKFPEPEEERPAMKEFVETKTSQTLQASHASQTAALAAPRQARVDAPPSPKRVIRPDYPKGARQRGEQGAVVLEIYVNVEGTVREARIVVSSGFAELDEAAVRAVEKAKFCPAKSGGKSVASIARLKLDFKLK